MRKIFLLIVGLPLTFTVLFGTVYSPNVVNNITLTVCDEDQSSTSRTLVNMYADSEKFLIVAHVATLDEVHAEIFSGRAKAALIIPKNFSREIKLGHGTEVSIVVNSSNNMFGNPTLSAAQELNRTFSIGVAQKLFEGANLLPDAAMATVYPIKMGVRILGNPTNGYSPFMLSGLLLNGLQIGIMLAFVTFLTDELQLRRDFTKIFYVRFIFRRVATVWLFGMVGFMLSLTVATKFGGSVYIFRRGRADDFLGNRAATRIGTAGTVDLHHARTFIQRLIVPDVRHERIRAALLVDNADDLCGRQFARHFANRSRAELVARFSVNVNRRSDWNFRRADDFFPATEKRRLKCSCTKLNKHSPTRAD